jgi:DNA-binding beta-propeller fold protein YncE
MPRFRRRLALWSLIAALGIACTSGLPSRAVGASGTALPFYDVVDVPLVGGTGRLDYESFDDIAGLLYVAHLGAGSVIVFDTNRDRVVTTIPGTPSVRGVLVVPELHRVYAAAQGTQEIVVIDQETNRTIARVKVGDVNGLAYDPRTQQLFVSDQIGSTDAVIDVRTNRLVTKIPLGGEAGNTQYDQASRHIFVAVQTRNELAEIDPRTRAIVRRYALPGCLRGHGVAIDPGRYAYVACQANTRIVRLNLETGLVDASSSIGRSPDVLSIDVGLERLYVASESGVVTVFDLTKSGFRKIGQGAFAPDAHVVGVDSRTHRVYFPIANLDGRPVLRITRPTLPGSEP